MFEIIEKKPNLKSNVSKFAYKYLLPILLLFLYI